MTAPLHPNIPVGYWSAHPPGYVQSVDPGAIGAHKIWVDTSTSPYTWKIRNAANGGWETVVGPSLFATQAALGAVESASIDADALLDGRITVLETDGAPPGTHASTHAEGGADPITITQAQVTGLASALAKLNLVTLSLQFGNGVTADAAGTVRTVRVPVGLTPVGWIADADAACTATFTVAKSPAGAEAWSSLVGSGTAPSLTAASHAADTDGAVDWSGGAVAQYGAIRVTLSAYTPGTSTRVTLTLLFARA